MTVVVTSLASIFPCSGYDLSPDICSVHYGFDFTIHDVKESQQSHKTPLWLGRISSIIQKARKEQAILQNRLGA